MPRAQSEYARSEYYEEDPDADFNDSVGSEDDEPAPRRSASRSGSMMSASGDDAAHIKASQQAMDNLHKYYEADGYKKVLKHRKGVTVYQKKLGGKTPPVFKGEGIIRGYSPSAVFAVVGSRKLWDEWYQDGSLVANLDDTTSLTYMSMKGIVGSSTRDLSLVERVEGASNGSIFFCSASVESNKIPRVSGRVRANILLNGWVLEPVREGGVLSTKATYVLQVNVKTIIPGAVSTKYLARRPVCISRIDDYLQKNGAPPMAGVDPSEQEGGRARTAKGGSSNDSGIGSSIAGGAAVGGGAASIKSGRRRRASSVASGRSRGGAAGFLDAGMIEGDHKSAKDLEQAKSRFQDLREGGGDWQRIDQDYKGSALEIKKAKGGLPIVRASARVEGVTTAQVVGTILSQSARRIWDKRWAESTLLDHGNGFDHGVWLEQTKGVFSRLDPGYSVLARGVEHDNGTDPNSPVDIISTSTDHKASAPSKHTKATVKVDGWHLEPEGPSEIQIDYVNQTDLGQERLEGVNQRIQVVSIGQAPRYVRDFIDQYGYAPYFVRWQSGPAQLKKDEGDLKKGEVTFHITGDGPKGNGEQKAWFQWSDKMYERGINLTIEPKGAVSVAKVDGIERTLQVTFDKPSELTISVEPYESNGADDVYVNGKRLDSTTSAPAGAGGAAAPRKSSKKPRGGAAAAAPRSDSPDEKENEEPAPKSSSKAKSAGGLAAIAAVPAAAAAAAAPVKAPVQENGTRAAPKNAMLIISDDLAFTGPQLAVIVALIAAVYAAAKFSK